MVTVTAVASGHDRDVTGQPAPGLPRAVAMAGVVQPRGPAGVELRCLACGAAFVAKRRDARTCSRRCAATLWPSRTRTQPLAGGRRCADADCDTVLTGRSDQRFCSDRCRKRAQRRRFGRAVARAPRPSIELTGHHEQAALFNVAGPQSHPVATRPARPNGRSAAMGHVQDRLL
jgi:predicted nucleic acid-binding Zn ribbon protein